MTGAAVQLPKQYMTHGQGTGQAGAGNGTPDSADATGRPPGPVGWRACTETSEAVGASPDAEWRCIVPVNAWRHRLMRISADWGGGGGKAGLGEEAAEITIGSGCHMRHSGCKCTRSVMAVGRVALCTCVERWVGQTHGCGGATPRLPMSRVISPTWGPSEGPPVGTPAWSD